MYHSDKKSKLQFLIFLMILRLRFIKICFHRKNIKNRHGIKCIEFLTVDKYFQPTFRFFEKKKNECNWENILVFSV